MSETRIYVIDGQGLRKRLVRASHKSLAIRHVAEAMMTATVATHNDLEELLAKQKIPVEQAGKPAPADAGGFVQAIAAQPPSAVMIAVSRMLLASTAGGSEFADRVADLRIAYEAAIKPEPECACREGTCESKPVGCRMAREIAEGGHQ